MFLKLLQIIKRLILFIKTNLFVFFIGILLFIIGLVLFFSMISYNPIDLVETGGRLNYIGAFGANISNELLQYFGFSAYFFVVTLFRLSFIIFREKTIKHYKFKLFSIFVCVITLSFLFASITELEHRFFNYLGGYIGYSLVNLIQNKIIFFICFFICFLSFITFSIFALDLHKTLLWSKISLKFAPSIANSSKVNTKPSRVEAIKSEFIDVTIPIPSIKKDTSREDGTNYIAQKINATLKYVLPAVSLLDVNSVENAKKNAKNISLTGQIEKSLHKALADFGIEAEVRGTKVGPVITMYEIEPKAGIRAARVVGLAEDIARSLKAKSARISLIPSSSSLAVEIPNKERETVFLRELIDSMEYKDAEFNIPITLGKSIAGDNIIVDLSTMPHLLIAGTTGSGKSVGVNAMILSVLYKLSPNECQFIMIDPKMLELSVYNDIPHLITPVITEPERAVMALKWLTLEMERRYRKMSALSVRNIFGYNEVVLSMKNAQVEGERPSKMPFIVVVIDEMADLMITAGKTIEAYIQRLAQMARAAGIHVIMATQRPSVDVITGIIKANFPTRISYQVSSKIDSRTILGTGGAEGLLGKGDMLYMQAGAKTYRIHAPFVSDNEVNNVVSFLKKSSGSMYNNIKVDIFEEVIESDAVASSLEKEEETINDNKSEDSLYKEALDIVLSENKPSISYIQRRLRIGYNKSANLIERMEREGYVSALQPSTGKRIILKNKS